VRGVQSIKLFGARRSAGRVAQPRGRRGQPRPRVAEAHARFRSANGLVFGIERVAIVWLGALLVLDSAFSVGMLFAFVAYKEQFSARSRASSTS
jgi:ATP-binding cassette subfamily B protein RaxB